MFGMGTGDPSQYGHRQIVRGEKIASIFGWRLAGGSPQWAATSALSRMVSPGPYRNTDYKLAPANWPERDRNPRESARSRNEIDWSLQGLKKKSLARLTARS